MIELLNEREHAVAKIKLIGVGGAGGNTVNSILESGYLSVESIVANTDSQALEASKADHKIQLGVKSTKGLGAGANPDIGKRAAEEDIDKILEIVSDADIVFLTGGLGGGTGSGALPVIARALKEQGILTITVVTKPFAFEGKRRATIAQQALEILTKEVDTLIVIPNQKLLESVDTKVSMLDAFAMINQVLGQSVKGISDIITKPGHINVDFADVKTIMQSRGIAVMGTARASGMNRAQEAALEAITSPLLENMNIEGAQGILLNITGGPDLALHEISEIASIMHDQAHPNANIIIGAVIDESMSNEVAVTLIATGFERTDAIKVEQPKDQNKQAVGAIRAEEQVRHAARIAEEPQAQTQLINQKAEDETKLKTIEHNAPIVVDQNDLDVPTFLRQESQNQSNN